MNAPKDKRRIGVYVCHCGGNISDYVYVDKVTASVEKDPDVVVAELMVRLRDLGVIA